MSGPETPNRKPLDYEVKSEENVERRSPSEVVVQLVKGIAGIVEGIGNRFSDSQDTTMGNSAGGHPIFDDIREANKNK